MVLSTIEINLRASHAPRRVGRSAKAGVYIPLACLIDDVESIDDIAVVTVETTVAWITCAQAYGCFATDDTLVVSFVYVF